MEKGKTMFGAIAAGIVAAALTIVFSAILYMYLMEVRRLWT